MTITIQPTRNEYTATAGQTVFNYTFKIFESTDLNVYQTPAGQEANDTNDIITAYSVSGVGNEDGGSITLTTGASVGDLITIVSDIPSNRITDYQINGDFTAPVVNNDFDRVVSLVKQAEDRVGRTLAFQESLQGVTELTLENPVTLNFVRWKSDLSGMENIDLTTLGSPTDSDIITYRAVSAQDALDTTYAFDTVADMVAATWLVVGMRVKTLGYSTIGDGGDNYYQIVAAGTGTDDGGSFIDLNTLQAKSLFPGGIINVKQFGAKGDGSTNDSTAIQAAIDYAIANLLQIPVYFPASTSYYILDSINLDGNDIVIDASEAYLRNTSTNPMFIIGATTAVQFADIKINRLLSSATSGHDFDFQGDFSMSTLYVGRLTHGNPATSIIYGKNAGSQFFFNTFDGKQWNTDSASSVSAIDIEGATNTCSENRFIFNRADRSGTEPFIKLKCTGAGQFFYNNKIECGWEVVNGGAVHLFGCSNHVITNGNFYDMGTTTKDLILLSSAGGNGCQNTLIINISRNSGTLGASLYDINLNDADETVIINCGSHNIAVGANFNINGKSATIINPTNATLTGDDTNAMIIDGDGTSKLSPNVVAAKTISAGVITASNSYHRVDTESAAATDDLDTINGGIDGMRLLLQSVANARDVTIKNGTGNIRLAGAADFTLTRITDTIELIYQTGSNEWCEISRSDNQT